MSLLLQDARFLLELIDEHEAEPERSDVDMLIRAMKRVQRAVECIGASQVMHFHTERNHPGAFSLN